MKEELIKLIEEYAEAARDTAAEASSEFGLMANIERYAAEENRIRAELYILLTGDEEYTI